MGPRVGEKGGHDRAAGIHIPRPGPGVPGGRRRDADQLIQRILFFQGRPQLTGFGPLVIGEDPASVLHNALAGELAAVALFNDSARESRDLGDLATAALFEAAAIEEETHVDWFEAQVDAVRRIGIERYLARQLAPGTGPVE